MMKEIYGKYADYKEENARKIERYDSLIDRHERIIEHHKKIRDKLYHKEKGWYDLILVPLAEAISARLGNLPYEVYGPFGLNAETTIYFFVGENRDICTGETYSITLFPCGYRQGFVLEYDTGERTEEYPPMSIGWLNGFNKVHAPLPDDLDDIMKLIRHSHATVEEAKDDNNQGE